MGMTMTEVTRVVVCGSLDYPELIEKAVTVVQAAGGELIAYPAADGLSEHEAAELWRRHIDAADEVVIVTKPDGTLGASTVLELGHAIAAGKRVGILSAQSSRPA